jgi:hypothetical protein
MILQGSFSVASLSGLEADGGLGVCHADDVHYLFNPHLSTVEYPALGTPADLHVRYSCGKVSATEDLQWLFITISKPPVTCTFSRISSCQSRKEAETKEY